MLFSVSKVILTTSHSKLCVAKQGSALFLELSLFSCQNVRKTLQRNKHVCKKHYSCCARYCSVEFGSSLVLSLALYLTSLPSMVKFENTHPFLKCRWKQLFDKSKMERSYLIVVSLNSSHMGPEQNYLTETDK